MDGALKLSIQITNRTFKIVSGGSADFFRTTNRPGPLVAAGTVDHRSVENAAHAAWHLRDPTFGDVSFESTGNDCLVDVGRSLDNRSERFQRGGQIRFCSPVEK